jgi:hypothetical protein
MGERVESRKGMASFEVDDDKRDMHGPEMVLDGAGAFSGDVLDDKYVHGAPGDGLS